MTCPTCLRPVATEADAKTWAASSDGTDTPEGWPDPDGSHLCWRETGGRCEPPEWWAAVTPLEVQTLRTENARMTADLDTNRETLEYLNAFGRTGVVTITRAEAIDRAVKLLRAARREAELGEARARAELEAMTPRWREGEPPADAQVWREYIGAKGPVVVYTFADHNDGRVLYYDFADNEPKEWGTARWCPIARPT